MTVAGVPFALLAFPLAFFLASLPHFIAAVVRLRNGINEDEPGWVVLSSDTRRHSLDAPEGKSSDSGREGRGSASSASGKPVDGLSGTLGREGPLANLPLGTPSSETVRMRRGSNVNIPNANGGQAAKILSIEEHRLGHDRAVFLRRLDITSSNAFRILPFFLGLVLLSLHYSIPAGQLDDDCFVFLALRTIQMFAMIFGTQSPRSILRTFAEVASIALLGRMWWRCVGKM